METNIQKWGNSLGVRIPQHIIQQLSLHSGAVVDITVENNHIVLYPKKYDLSAMLNNITKNNLHSAEWDDDSTKGKEEW